MYHSTFQNKYHSLIQSVCLDIDQVSSTLLVVFKELLSSYLAGSPGSLLKDNCTKLLDFEFMFEINTLEWEDLVGSEVQNDASIMRDGVVEEQVFK